MRQGTHTHPFKAFAEEGWLGVTGVKGRASRQRWIYLIFSTKFPLFRPHNAAAVVVLLLAVQFGRYECGCMPHCCAAGVMPTNSLSFGGWAFVLSHKKTLFFGGFSAETRKSADTHTRARTQTHMCLLDLHAFALTLSLGIPRFSITLAYYFWFLYFMLLFIFCFIVVVRNCFGFCHDLPTQFALLQQFTLWLPLFGLQLLLFLFLLMLLLFLWLWLLSPLLPFAGMQPSMRRTDGRTKAIQTMPFTHSRKLQPRKIEREKYSKKTGYPVAIVS